jgi:hypothetical protein
MHHTLRLLSHASCVLELVKVPNLLLLHCCRCAHCFHSNLCVFVRSNSSGGLVVDLVIACDLIKQ